MLNKKVHQLASEAQMYILVNELVKWITTTCQHGLHAPTPLSRHSVN